MGTRTLSTAVCGVVVALSLALTGCAQNPLFFKDERVTIVEPAPLAEVTLPFTVRWDSEIPAPQRYAVFVGDTPIGVGQTLDDFVERQNDRQCLLNPDCPDEAYLARNHVYVTDGTEVEISRIPALGPGVSVVTVRIILLDEDGRRHNESAWDVRIKPRIER